MALYVREKKKNKNKNIGVVGKGWCLKLKAKIWDKSQYLASDLLNPIHLKLMAVFLKLGWWNTFVLQDKIIFKNSFFSFSFPFLRMVGCY